MDAPGQDYLDAERARYLMKTLLEHCVKQQAS